MDIIFYTLIIFTIFVFYNLIKLLIASSYGIKAIDLVYKDISKYRELQDKYLYFIDAGFYTYWLFWINPFKWTFNQYFPGLESSSR